MAVRRWIALLLVACVSPGFTLGYEVRCTEPESAVLGENATFSCYPTGPGKVVQITWAKGSETVASNSDYGPQVREKFADHFSISPWHGDNRDASSSLTISNLKEKHEGIYTCKFTYMADTFVTGEIRLTNISKSNETRIVLAESKEIGSRGGNKERDVEESVILICPESRKRHLLKATSAEGPGEVYVLGCRVSGAITPEGNRKITGSPSAEYILFIDVTNATRSLLAPNISYIWINDAKGISKKITCLVNGTRIVLAYPSGRVSKEIGSRGGNKERDVEESVILICTESRKRHLLKEMSAEGPEETYDLECRPEVYENITENPSEEYPLSTVANVTRSWLVPMFSYQNISCTLTNDTKDDSKATKTMMAVLIPILLLGGALGIGLYCRSKRSKNKIGKDGSPPKSSEEIPLDKVTVPADDSEEIPHHHSEETPTKDSSLMNAENNGLLSNAKQHVARKLF